MCWIKSVEFSTLFLLPYRTVALFFREVKEFREVREEVFTKLIKLSKLTNLTKLTPPLINAGML